MSVVRWANQKSDSTRHMLAKAKIALTNNLYFDRYAGTYYNSHTEQGIKYHAEHVVPREYSRIVAAYEENKEILEGYEDNMVGNINDEAVINCPAVMRAVRAWATEELRKAVDEKVAFRNGLDV